MRGGYLKLYRKLFENPVVMKDAEYLAIWVYLLGEAKWEPTEAYFGGKKIMLQAGQFTIGRKQIADKLRVTESKCQRVLKCYEDEHLIEQQTSNRNRLITIVKWAEYQGDEQQTEQQMNNQRTTNEQQMNTPEEIKNKRNNNNVQQEVKKEFDALWEIYPNKKGKRDAERHYRSARKQGATFEEVKAGIEAYVNYINQTGTDPQYVKMGSSFFCQRAWEDKWTVPEKKPQPKSNVPTQQEPPKYKTFEKEPERKAEPMTAEQREKIKRTLA